MSTIGLPEVLVIVCLSAIALSIIWPAARICRRLGFPRWLGILAIVPMANVLLVWFVAFAAWPIEKQSRSQP